MATKKITELPFINTLSGSTVFDNPVLNTVIPVVLYGTTNQITVENFSKFTNLYAAQTGSQNTFTAQNIFNQNQWFNAIVSASTINVGTLGVGGNTTIVGTLGVTGNGTIGGNLVVNGKLTAQEVYTEITSASIIFESGSTKFGDDTGDKHQFTGSINVSGSVIYNGVILTNIDANTIQKLQQATASIELASASFNYFYQSTASLQTFTASQADRNLVLSTVTGSINQATASLQTFTSSQADRNLVLSTVTGSINQATASLQFHSASVEAQLARIQQATASLELASASFKYFYQSTASLQTFTSSQADRNLVLSTVTGSINQATASLNQFTASQDSRNLTLSTVTGSLIGITNGLMAFTAALDNTYATDAQLYQLYQATRSLELHSGSMIGVTNGLMAYTASNTSLNTGLRGEVDGIEAYTASLKGQAIVSSSTQIQNYDLFALNSNLYNGTGSIKAEVAGIESYTASLKAAAIVSSSTQVQNYDLFALNSNLYTSTGSLIGITNGLMAFTAALDSTYATDAQLFQLYQATRSIELTTGSLIGITNGLMAFTASLDNTFATDVQLLPILQATRSLELLSGSLIGITNGLMAFTAALDSTYATDAQLYQLYAETASIKAEIGGIEAYTASLKAAIEVSGQNVNVLGMITAQQFNVTYVSSSVMYRSGSTEFGDSSDDRHLFTGSLIVSGTLELGTSDNGIGRILFNESINTLRIQSSKNGTDCTPISFWSQASGGGFAESVTVSGSSLNVKSGGILNVYRTDNTRALQLYTTINECVIDSWEASSEPLHIRSMGSGGRIQFYTSGSEKLRITSTGYQKGTNDGTTYVSLSSPYNEFTNTANSNNTIFNAPHASLNTDGIVRIDANRVTTDNSYYVLTVYNGGSGLYKFRVADSGNVTNTNNSYGALSDIKLKENIVDATPKLDNLLKVKVRNFNYIGNEEKQLGVVAQELEQVFPSMIELHKDRDTNGEDLGTTTKAVKYSVFVPMLIKAVQEQQSIIEELKARIEVLENK